MAYLALLWFMMAFCLAFQYQDPKVKPWTFFTSGWYRFMQVLLCLTMIFLFFILKGIFGYEQQWLVTVTALGTIYLMMITINSVFLSITKRIQVAECLVYFLISLCIGLFYIYLIGENLVRATHHN